MYLYFGVGSAHKRYIRKYLVHKRERNLTKEVRGSKGQGGSAGRGVSSLDHNLERGGDEPELKG